MLPVATFLRVYAAGRYHVGHPLDGKDPDTSAQSSSNNATTPAPRLAPSGCSSKRSMPNTRCRAHAEPSCAPSAEYPLDDLHDAERRFRAHACHCQVRLCDRYFAAVVRNVHDSNRAHRAAERTQRRAASEARRTRADAAQRATDLDAHPERRLQEGLDLLADTWQPDTRDFVHDGLLALIWLRRAVHLSHAHEPIATSDRIEALVRSWEASRPNSPRGLCDAVRGALRDVITEFRFDVLPQSRLALVDAILASSTRTHHDNQRPPPSPHLRI
jgi:hypothetical protein